MRRIFAIVIQTGGSGRALKALRGVTIPPWPPELHEYMVGAEGKPRRSALRPATALPDGSRLIGIGLIQSVVANRAYLGEWTFAGERIPRDVLPSPIVDPVTFERASAILGQTGRPRGRHADAEPMLLTGLVLCLQHDPPRRVHTGGDRDERSYRCDGYLSQGRAARTCTYIADRTLDGPISEYVLQRLRAARMAEDVLAALEAEQTAAETNRDDYDRRRRALQHELDTIATQLTRTTNDRLSQRLMARYDDVERELANLGAISPTPVRADTIDLGEVRRLLANIDANWSTLARATRRRLLIAFLDRIELRHTRDTIDATITWRTGHVETIRIERPAKGRAKCEPWTEADRERFRELWPLGTPEEIQATWPHRPWSHFNQLASELGVRRLYRNRRPGGKRRAWTPAEDAQLERWLSGEVTAEELALELDRTAPSVRHRVWKLGLQWRGTHAVRPAPWRVVEIGNLFDVGAFRS
ncbi:MAG: hypothetical protein HY329_28365 [Chloroflexi bacterium]|nr:hypothetical protein [Chloroflexota bacterium]